jgi:hypothetical protein
VRVEFRSLTGVFSSPLPTPLIAPVGYLVEDPVLVPGAARPSLEEDPTRFIAVLSAVPLACSPKRDDDPALDKPPGGLSPGVEPSF